MSGGPSRHRRIQAGPRASAASSAEVFVGRDDELALLDARLEEARSGSPGFVIVEGAPGIGKTALVRRFLTAHPELGVLSASGDETERSLPFGIADQLLEAAGAPRVEEGGQGVPDPFLVGARLVELVGGLQARRPLVVVVDDAHWADRPSLHSLTFALRRLRADRVLTLLTLREGHRAQLPEGLQRLRVDNPPTVLHLDGLPASDLQDLAATLGRSRPSLAMAERLREHTAGNPLHLRALLEELPAGWSFATQLPLPCPQSYSLLVLHRLASCPKEAQELVVAASVLGVQCRLADAARLAQVEDTLPALDAAVAAQLLQAPAVPGGGIAFRHPLVRSAVYHDLGPARRAALHTRASTIVSEPAAALQHRVAATVGEDPALAADLLAHARAEASRGALEAAARSTLAAAELSEPRQRQSLLLEGVELLLIAGDVAGAQAMAAAVEAVADGPRRRYILGMLALRTGRWDDADVLLTTAWHEAGTRDPDLRARIAGELARLASLQCRGQDAAQWALQAGAARGTGAEPAPGALDLAVGLGMSGLAEEGLARLRDLHQPGRAADPATLEGTVARGMLKLWTDDLAGARKDLSAAAEAARTHGPAHLWTLARGQLSEVEYRAGDWNAAITNFELAVSAARDAEQIWLLPYLHAVATAPLVGRGQWQQAASHVRASAEAARMLAVTSATCCAAIAEATLCVGQGDHQQAVEALEPLRRLDAQGLTHEPGTLPWAELNVEALLALGQLDEAGTLLDDLERIAAKRKRRSAMIDAARLRGLLLAARGRMQPAEVAFRHGLSGPGHSAFPFRQARLEAALARHLKDLGRTREAAELLRQAHERFGRLGAVPFVEQCERELLTCGSTPARRAVLKGAALTPQELAVATLVCTGRSNREVAAEMVLSVKTIEFHLGNAFAKLGVTSRTQLCARLASEGPDKPRPSARDAPQQ